MLTDKTIGSVVAVLVIAGLLQVVSLYSQTPGNELVVDTGGNETIATDPSVENSPDHEDPEDYIWDGSEVIPIVLNGAAISASGIGATVDGSRVTVTRGGTYSLSGILEDGQIIVNSGDKKTVRLILDGADIRCSSSAPIIVENAKKTIVVLAENTKNYVADGRSGTVEDSQGNEPNAAIFSKDDLTIWGAGSLTVRGNVNDAISCRNGLIIAGGTIDINTVDDGIRGKDYLVVRGGTITVNAGGDGLKSDNDEDPNMGYVSIESGVIRVTSGADAIQAKTDVLIADGEITLSAGGGSGAKIAATTSAKGIKGVGSVVIDGGDFTVDSADDAIHSNGDVTINGGAFVLSSGDDGIHADANLVVNDGDIHIAKSYEGMESTNANITINGGTIHIVSSDDGINVAGGGDAMGGPGGAPGGMPGGGPGVRPGQGGVTPPTAAGNYYLYINGGYLAVDAMGDGIDSNGSIAMTDGFVVVHGPTANDNGALDHSSFKMTGGFIVAAGSSGMAQTTSTTSS